MFKTNYWYCEKCNDYIGNNIDIDYHDNTKHPNFKDPYVVSWYNRGCPGLSPYD